MARARDVVQKVVEQVGDGVVVECTEPLVDQVLDLSVGLTKKSFQRHRGFQPAIQERLEHPPGHPPQLVHVVAVGGSLQVLHDAGQRLDVALVVTPLDPAQQRDLEFRAQLAGYLHGILAAGFMFLAAQLLLRRQVQQQERALGKKGLAARRAQVVQHRQQHQRDVPTAANELLKIDGQLHHGPRQRIEAVRTTFAGTKRRQVPADRLHFLGEQGRAIGLGHFQNATDLVQQLRAANQGS